MNFSLGWGLRPALREGARALVAMAAAAAFAGVAAAADAESSSSSSTPTPDEYVSHVGGDAKVVAPGQVAMDRMRLICGQRPTVLDNKLDDYGAAYPGFLILNPRLLAKVPTAVKLWIFYHECGHQFRGPNEETADCFAVQRGRREGWLTAEGLDQVCQFITPAKGDSMHFSGPHRCEAMRECYADRTVR